MPSIDPGAAAMAAQCRHYAMCKIDYLGTGICPSGPDRGFVAFYPEGRMDLVRGLAEGRIPVTEALLESADTCTMCGLCDGQCHFVTGMRPTEVMQALMDYVAEFRRAVWIAALTAHSTPIRMNTFITTTFPKIFFGKEKMQLHHHRFLILV